MRVVSLAVGALLCLLAPARAAEIVPHEAHYRLMLDTLNMPGEVRQAGGELAFRLARSCTEWTLGTRMVFRIELEGGRSSLMDTAAGYRESLDGETLAFEIHQRVNGETVLTSRGTATMPKSGGPGRAIFTQPKEATVSLPTGTLFPIAATRGTLRAIAVGKTFNTYPMFDGSDPAGPFRYTDFVAGDPLTLSKPPSGDTALLESPSWQVQSSLFRLDGQDAEPMASQTLQLHANGVTSRLRLDLGMLKADAELAEIRELPVPDCK